MNKLNNLNNPLTHYLITSITIISYTFTELYKYSTYKYSRNSKYKYTTIPTSKLTSISITTLITSTRPKYYLIKFNY